MKKLLIIILVLATLGVIGFFSYRAIQARRQVNTISSLETVTASMGSLTSTVGATGTVRPDQTAMLTWDTTGNVDQVFVEVGDVITGGQKLAALSPASLPQNIILAQNDLITARNALTQLTNPDLSTISNAEKTLAAAYTSYQQAHNDLTNAIITNQNANEPAFYNEWFNAKAALDVARNHLPLANASIDVQAYYQAVRKTSQLQDELTIAQNSASAHPQDVPLAQKVADLQVAVQDSLANQNKLQPGLSADTVELAKSLSDNLSAYEASTNNFIGTVLTDTLNTSVDLAQVQADLAQKQSALIDTQNNLTDLVNHRQTMNGKRCDDKTISDYQDAYDNALNAYNFTGHIANSREYQLLQTAAANLNWCTAVWSEADIAAQDAKIASAQAQVQLLQAQITADQTQITDATNSVYGLAIYLNNVWTAYQDASQQLSNAVLTLYQLERSPNPDDLAAAQARLQAAQITVDSRSLIAPFAGTITEVDIKPGDVVAPGSIAFRLDNLDRMLVDVLVSEVDINNVKVGQPVNLSFDAILDKQYKGTVNQVAPVGDILQGVVEFSVTVELTDADQNVKPGMTAAVNIVVEQIAESLLVPNRAVRLVNGQRVVYILSNNQLQAVDVTLGASSDTQSQVIGGDLKAGDQIVLNPPQDLFSSGGPFGGR
ncbi:MAG TPA: efflux RND transporter periplasmic adaptor subunit [Anaerolineales bacterium]